MFAGGRPAYSTSSGNVSSETFIELRTMLDNERQRRTQLQERFDDLNEQFSKLRDSSLVDAEKGRRVDIPRVDAASSEAPLMLNPLLSGITLMMGEVTSLTRVLGKAISGDGDFDAGDLFAEGEQQGLLESDSSRDVKQGDALSAASLTRMQKQMNDVRHRVREVRQSLNDSLARSLGSGCAFQ